MHIPQWVQVGDDIDGEAPGDESGRSVALSSNGAVLAIGAPGNDGFGDRAGHLRVYVNIGGEWRQRGRDLDGSAGAEFGYAVALSADGTIFAVGVRLANNEFGEGSGRVVAYRWVSGDWQTMGSSIEGEGQFGSSVALSDDGIILAVGAPFLNRDPNTGLVRVFAWTGRDWNRRGLNLLGLTGYSVSLSSDGSIVASGGPWAHSGRVRIYRWSESGWRQLGSTLVGFSSNDGFGTSVSLSGDGTVVAVGAARDDSYAVAFRNDGAGWVQIGQTIRVEDGFGFSLSLSFDGSTVVIGGYLNDSNGTNSGHALVYRFSPNGQEWVQVGQELLGERVGDRFGISTSISDDGTRIAIGADGNDGNGVNTGSVRVYDFQ